jgi:hypothetical protein
VTDTYDGPERRWTTEFPPGWHRNRLLMLAVVFLAVMLPLGYLVLSARQSELRAERAGRSVCELARTVDHLAATLDTGVQVLTAPDDTERAKTTAALRQLAAGAQRVQAETAKACGLPSAP